MRIGTLVVAATLMLPISMYAKTILPDACGEDSAKFDVKTEKDQPAPAGPEAGKAQIIFIQNSEPYEHFIPPIRYGMDGTWVGANQGNSYFALSVEPGEHHLCSSLQMGAGRSSMVKDSAQLATFTAEAGKTYYFEAGINVIKSGTSGPDNITFDLKQLTDDVGKYRIKAWKRATFRPK